MVLTADYFVILSGAGKTLRIYYKFWPKFCPCVDCYYLDCEITARLA